MLAKKEWCILLVTILVTIMVCWAFFRITIATPRSEHVEIEERKGGYVFYMFSDEKHWEEDGKKVEGIVSEKEKEFFHGGRLPGRLPQVVKVNSDVFNKERGIYIRRIHLWKR